MAATTAFARARTEQQREQRREAILAAAAGMLGSGTRIGDLTLNELSRCVGLAKSNVLRYFESREAILLELLDSEYGAWLEALADALDEGRGDRERDRADEIERASATLARTVVERPVLSELVANAQVVLEQNVSAEVAARYKRRAFAQAMQLVELLEGQVGALAPPSRLALAGAVNLAIGGVWGQCRPSPGMVAAYERYPELAAMRLDHLVALRELVATVLTGLLARPART